MLTITGAVALVLYLASADKNQDEGRKPAEEPTTSKDRQAEKDPAAVADRDKKPPPKEFMTVLPRAKQLQVNQAIEAGKKFLKKHQNPEGVWDNDADKNQRHRVGRAALPALTLLECGEPASDPVIVRAAQYVRDRCRRLRLTYDIALAILLLDRLGESSDEALIHTLALRLVAGQTSNGGWSYKCPLLEPEEDKQLAKVLKDLPLTSKLELMAGPRPKKSDPNRKIVLEELDDGQTDKPDDTKLVLADQQIPRQKLQQIEELPPHLQGLPVLRMRPESEEQKGQAERSDNSNTQFAILALWAARRHHLPLDRTLALIVKRFRTSQFATGGWGYGYAYTLGVKNRLVGRPAMTCAGLLGLAIGHGLARNISTPEAPATRDRAVDRALQAIGRGLARLQKRVKRDGDERFTYNLYLLWSLERVGVIYKLKKIGGVDWYTWGTDLLLDGRARAADGSWQGSRYPGNTPTINTCLALLFLKRVNLAKDLTDKLVLEVSDSNR
jgi:hypothetical protein